MKDFIKIFFSLILLVITFLFGRNYGEKTYLESAERHKTIKATEDLNFAKAEFENAKAKLQNIIDRSDTLKTDELLVLILQVFSTDLGLNTQKKDSIINKSQQNQELQLKESNTEKNEGPAPYPELKQTSRSQEKENIWSKNKISKFKSLEWMVENANDNMQTMRGLKKIQIKNMGSFLEQASNINSKSCSDLLGSYKGPIKDIDKNYMGSIEIELKEQTINNEAQLAGKLAWYNSGAAVVDEFKDGCGKTINELSGRILNLTNDKYVQIYKQAPLEQIVGNFYQVSPNATTTLVGTFILKRVDRF